MTPAQLIRKKRDGGAFTRKEIDSFVEGVTDGSWSDYHLAAWLMAVTLRGMSHQETVDLTRAMLHSGDVLSLRSVRGPRVDKHSTGGVGDKVTLCLAPMAAACGIAVPMVAGRGLGHTGGTLDKLESIPGYRTVLSAKRFEAIVRTVGTSIIGQSSRIAPADRRMYAMRDVTATVECIPLIVASILSKKLASGIDGLVLDVKVGRGAFMKELPAARQLARALVSVGRGAGKSVTTVLTRMDEPLGRSIGNALEVREALDVLRGCGPEDTTEVTYALGVEMLMLAGLAKNRRHGKQLLEHTVRSGEALDVFRRLVRAHGGDVRVVDEPERLPSAPRRIAVRSPRSGYVTRIDPLVLGELCVQIGGGRLQVSDEIDPAVGIELAVKTGDRVSRGGTLAVLHLPRRRIAGAERHCLGAFSFSSRRPPAEPVVIERFTRARDPA